MTPQSVGVPANRLVLGKHSGRHALRNRYHELGIDLDNRDLEQIYVSFTKLADRQKDVADRDLLALLHQQEQCASH